MGVLCSGAGGPGARAARLAPLWQRRGAPPLASAAGRRGRSHWCCCSACAWRRCVCVPGAGSQCACCGPRPPVGKRAAPSRRRRARAGRWHARPEKRAPAVHCAPYRIGRSRRRGRGWASHGAPRRCSERQSCSGRRPGARTPPRARSDGCAAAAQEAAAELERLEYASYRPQERLAGSGRPRFCRKCEARRPAAAPRSAPARPVPAAAGAAERAGPLWGGAAHLRRRDACARRTEAPRLLFGHGASAAHGRASAAGRMRPCAQGRWTVTTIVGRWSVTAPPARAGVEAGARAPRQHQRALRAAHGPLLCAPAPARRRGRPAAAAPRAAAALFHRRRALGCYTRGGCLQANRARARAGCLPPGHSRMLLPLPLLHQHGGTKAHAR